MNERVANVLLAFLALFMGIQFLKDAQIVFLPLLVALLLSFLALPVVAGLTKLKVPAPLAVGLVLVLVLCLLGGLGLLVRESVSGFIDKYPQYQPKIEGLWRDVTSKLGVTGEHLQQFELAKKGGEFLQTSLNQMLNILGQFFLVLFFLMFLLLGQHGIALKIQRAFDRGEEIQKVLDEIQRQVVRYVSLKTATSLATGIVVWVVLAAYGVDFSLLWGVLAFALNFIPTVGSIVATVPPIVIALIQFDTWTAIWVTAWLTGVQMIIGNLIEPRVMGQGLDLDPLVVLLGLVFFGWMWNIVGAILAVPLLVVVKIVCAHIGGLEAVAVMMGMGTLPVRASTRKPGPPPQL
jgi:predicted PurR-regulated permease PerM